MKRLKRIIARVLLIITFLFILYNIIDMLYLSYLKQWNLEGFWDYFIGTIFLTSLWVIVFGIIHNIFKWIFNQLFK